MPFQIGNTVARDNPSPKPFREALMMAIKDADGDYRRLRRIASKLLTVAERGNVAAIKEIADRLDGKVPQALINDDDGSPMILQVVRYVVEPQAIDITPALATASAAELSITSEADIKADDIHSSTK